MNLLGIETSTNACSVALSFDGKVLLKHALIPREHVKKILLFVDSLLQEAGCQLSSLDAIAVGIGPGSFTGLRIALSVAQGLAYGADLQLIPVSSLQTIAQTAYEATGAERVFVGMDARMQEVYWGEYRLDTRLKLMLPEQVDQLTKPEVCCSVFERVPLGVGSAFAQYNLPVSPERIDDKMLPKADSALKIAVENARKGRIIAPGKVVINYLRNEIAHKAPHNPK